MSKVHFPSRAGWVEVFYCARAVYLELSVNNARAAVRPISTLLVRAAMEADTRMRELGFRTLSLSLEVVKDTQQFLDVLCHGVRVPIALRCLEQHAEIDTPKAASQEFLIFRKGAEKCVGEQAHNLKRAQVYGITFPCKKESDGPRAVLREH